MAEHYYKYRSVNNLERLTDIIREKRLWASTYKDLNDPMEWFFRSKQKDFDDVVLSKHKKNARICSVSKSRNYGLMWSMYADEHRGVCIEFSIDENEIYRDSGSIDSESWRKFIVKYSPESAEIEENVTEANRDTIVDNTLGIKSKQWEHEQEVRFVKFADPENCFIKIKIHKIYLGVRMSDENKAFIYSLKSHLEADFEIVDLASLNDVNMGVNYWNDYNGEPFSQEV